MYKLKAQRYIFLEAENHNISAFSGKSGDNKI